MLSHTEHAATHACWVGLQLSAPCCRQMLGSVRCWPTPQAAQRTAALTALTSCNKLSSRPSATHQASHQALLAAASRAATARGTCCSTNNNTLQQLASKHGSLTRLSWLSSPPASRTYLDMRGEMVKPAACRQHKFSRAVAVSRGGAWAWPSMAPSPTETCKQCGALLQLHDTARHTQPNRQSAARQHLPAPPPARARTSRRRAHAAPPGGPHSGWVGGGGCPVCCNCTRAVHVGRSCVSERKCRWARGASQRSTLVRSARCRSCCLPHLIQHNVGAILRVAPPRAQQHHLAWRAEPAPGEGAGRSHGGCGRDGSCRKLVGTAQHRVPRRAEPALG